GEPAETRAFMGFCTHEPEHLKRPEIHACMLEVCTGSRHRTRLQARGCGHNLWDVICRTAEPLAWDRRGRSTSKEVERRICQAIPSRSRGSLSAQGREGADRGAVPVE